MSIDFFSRAPTHSIRLRDDRVLAFGGAWTIAGMSIRSNLCFMGAFGQSCSLACVAAIVLIQAILAVSLTGQTVPAKGSALPMKEGNVSDAQPLSPEEQLKRFVLPEGFVIELIASEADGAGKPTSLAFDEAGRLWWTTATAYPRDLNIATWTQPGPDHIMVLERPSEGPRSPRRIFADRLVMPMSVLPQGTGAFVAQGPEIVRLDDTDGDGRADKRIVLLHGFGVQDTHTLPHQIVQLPGGRLGFSQGLLNDGVVFDADGRGYAFPRTLMASMTERGTDLRIHSAGLNNIWGWDRDALGRVFIHEANDFGYSVIPFEEDSSYPSFIDAKLHPDAPMHPPTAEGLGLGGTGFCGLAIYDDPDGSFPAKWHDNIFVANPITGKVHAVTRSEGKNGVWRFARNGDLVSCSDPMFRPVALLLGPDDCLYIADWYNRIISHNEVPRDHPGRDKHHGRIWRVRHRSQVQLVVQDYGKATPSELIAGLKSGRRWVMRTAWQQIAQRKLMSALPTLSALVDDEAVSLSIRIQALWALESLGHFDSELWRRLLSNADYNLRREAVRSLTGLRVSPTEALPLLRTLASEPRWTVRYEALRYLRRASAGVPDWMNVWRSDPAPATKVDGWKGPYLALDGSYQRAFQDFLFMLVETKTQLPQGLESKWNSVLPREDKPATSAEINRRIRAVQSQLPRARVESGRILFEGMCLNCHSLMGKGVGFAPPLDGSGNRDLEGLIRSIVAPDDAIENVFRLFRVRTKSGDVLEGFKQNEIRNQVSLLFMGGGEKSVPFSQIESAGYVEGRSVMPNLASGMGTESLADIVAYLQTL